ncbi:MAG: glycosyltransferase family 4 protein [Parvicellaceae bacterium]
MRVLQICHKPPLPSIDGGCIAINNISRGLIKELESIKVLTINTLKHPFDLKHYDQNYLEKSKIESTFVDTKLNIVDAFSNLVTYDSYNISRFFSPDFNELIIKTLKSESFDIILLESLFTTPYIETLKTYSSAKIILRSHNLEYIIWKRLSKESANPAKKIYLKLLSSQLKQYELDIFNKIDGIATISDEDKRKYNELNCPVKIETIPFGIETQKYKVSRNKNKALKFFHIGAMDWKPNLEAVSWLLNEIWPRIQKQIPNAELHLAGKNMPDWLFKNSKHNIFNHKEVKDSSKFIIENDIMIVPLLSAGGIRVKIIEGMAYGKAIISTQIGAEGINYKNGENIIIANNPEDFSEKAKKISSKELDHRKIGMNAREHVTNNYDQKHTSKKLISFFETVL